MFAKVKAKVPPIMFNKYYEWISNHIETSLAQWEEHKRSRLSKIVKKGIDRVATLRASMAGDAKIKKTK